MPTFTGNNGNNTINGSNGDDTIFGLGGNDHLFGRGGHDTIFGGTGHDEIEGNDGNDTLHGEDGNDEMSGGTGNDVMTGGTGDDEMSGGDNDDTMSGGSGDDEMSGGDDNDVLAGDADDDIVEGDDGDDDVSGGSGNDALFGGSGNDTLTGGGGLDFIDGGSGTDTAVYSGSLSEYTIYQLGPLTGIVHNGPGGPGSGADGADLLVQVERLQFSDVTIDLTGNNAPVAFDDVAALDEDDVAFDSGTASVVDNDFDFEGDTLTVTPGVFNGTYGTLTLNADGTYDYVLNANAQTLAQGQIGQDSFSYTVSDGSGSDTGNLVFSITGLNDAPEANPDADTTSENAVLLIDVLANDDDVDNGSVLTLIAASAPAGQGNASVVGNQVEFDPGSDFDDLAVGDSEIVLVSYTIQDEHGASDSSTITITVTGTNDGPVANPDVDTTSENAVLLIDVLANDTDVDNGAVLTVTAASAPAGQGTASVVGNQVEFDPGTDFDYLAVGESAVVVLDYSIEDEHGASDSSTVTITVTGTNDAPTIDAGGTDASGSVTELPDNDPDENAFTHQDSGSIAFDDADLSDTHSASFTPQGGGYVGTFTLDPVNQAGDSVGWDFSVEDSDIDFLDEGETLTQTYTVEIDDGNGGTVTQDVTITITGAGDGPQTEWYIDNSAVGSANLGTQADPFTSIAAFNAAQGTMGGPAAGHTVFLLAGTGIYAEADGINLLDDQTLIGIASGPLRPTIVTTGAGNHGIELAQDNNISGVDIGSTTGAGISDGGGSVGTLVIGDVAKSGAGQVIDIDQGGLISVQLNSAASTGSAGGAIDLDGVAGEFTVSGATTIAGLHSDGGVDVTGSSAIISLTGGGLVSTGTSAAINFAGNSGALVIADGLDIVTTSGAGLNATGGGTISITGSGNSITSAGGTALIISSTTIAPSGLTFESISANGGTNGIVLANTGTSGGLNVVGDGGGTNNGSGGTIQNMTGDGIMLTNTEDFRIAYMNIQNNADNGIGGSGVNGFVLNRVNISGNGDSDATDDSGIDIANLTGSASSGSRPTSITNSVISNNHEFEIQITNTSGTLTNLQVIDSQISSNGATGVHGNLFNFLSLGTASMGLTVSGSTFDGNTVAGALTGTALHADASGGTIIADVGTSNFIDNNVAVNMSTATGGNLTFDVHDNGQMTGNRSNAINVFSNANATGTINGTIQDNVIGTQGVAASGSALGRGIQVSMSGGGTTNLLITGNTVQSVAQFEGISVVENVTPGIVNATITDNIIQDIAAARGLVVQTAGTGTINTSISGNQFINVAGPPGDPNATVLRVNEGGGGTLNVTQLAPSAAVNANELDDANNIPSTRVSVAGTPQFGQPAPTLPSAPSLPLLAATESPEAAVDALGQSELDLIVSAAIERWAAAGATAGQIEAMRAVPFDIANMSGLAVGLSGFGQVTIDDDAAGFGWFVDATPGEDEEYGGSGTRLTAAPDTEAGSRMDLLTTVMHELGHQIGLGDVHDSDHHDELMLATINPGERRLPDGVFEAETAMIPAGRAEWGYMLLPPLDVPLA